MPCIEYGRNESLTLTEALLIYRSSREVIATRHPVSRGVIQPGAPVDVASVKKLLDAPEQEESRASGDWQWHFPRLLAENADYLVWWSPPGIQRVFIGQEGKKPRTLEAWIPALVWCARRTSPTCYLWAYDGANAPTPTTDIYRPQFGPTGALNHVHSDSRICVGSTKLTDYTPASWERGFWSSSFKVPGNLKAFKPYACKEKFIHLGTLQANLSRCSSSD